jgi:hypothetical protein
VVYIAGSPGPEGSFQLYAVPIEGGAGVRLNGRLPSGGDTLAFEPFCSPEVGCGIAGRFQITPDGRRVVYQADQRVDERFELFAAPLPDFRRHARLDRERSWRILAGAGSVADFEITPDGRTLVYLGFFQGLFALHRVPIEGGSPVRLTGGASLVGGVGERASFTLAPDGASALFLADLSSTHRYELFDVPLDGSHPPQRVNGPLPPNGDVRSGFRFGANGRVFYMADQARDEVVELYATGARLARRAELR